MTTAAKAKAGTKGPRRPPPHWLGQNHQVWSPDAVLVLDTESTWSQRDTAEIHIGRNWAMTATLRHDTAKEHQAWRIWAGDSFPDLAARVDQLGRETKETWLFAHNLGFDLSVTMLPERLTGLGWAVKDLWLGDQATWMVLSTERHKLVLTDSWSWLSMSLEEIAGRLGRKKNDLPDNDGSPRAWAARCRVDVEVLEEALITLMDFWDANELGRWSITGAGCGWAAARHMLPAKSIVVSPGPERTAFERQAIYGGRREAFRVGHFSGVTAMDYDFVMAYTAVAATTPLPTRPGGAFKSLPIDSHALRSTQTGVIAEVTVTTDTPLVPCHHKGEVWWPVGTFKTVLAGPEIAMAIDHGAKVEIGAGQSYHLTRGLEPWARWAMALASSADPAVPSVVRALVKGWCRSTLGRFASRTSREIMRRPATRFGWHLEHGRQMSTGAPLDIVTIGGEERWLLRDQDGPDCAPAIWCWVESVTRAALTATIETRPAGSVIQCDTDGWLELTGRTRASHRLPWVAPPFEVAVKGRYSAIRVLAATQLWLDKERRLAGIGRDSVSPEEDHFLWWDWPGLSWQLMHSQPGEFTRTKRVATVKGDAVRRWILSDGSTRPVTFAMDPGGENHILPWSDTHLLEPELTLGDIQHPALVPLS